MNLSSSHLSWPLGLGENPSLEVLSQDGERVLCRGWQHDGDADRTAVLAVLSHSASPTSGFFDRLAHEYALKDELDGRSAVRPVALVHDHGRTMLLSEDPGGQALDSLLGRPLEIGRFLPIAIGLSVALRHLHERGLIHKDIKPANVLVDSATGRAWLMGFGISSRLPRERQAPEPAEFIAGSLPYMSPEQTGRMNRSVDSRSDLYALGVTLYEMLTGSFPFTASDPMEWVHCHIARPPVPPLERVADVPAAISAIILKLLAKTVEERYQTAAGVEADLRRSLAEWNSGKRIDAFPLGLRDTPDRLLIPEKLYGRAREIDTMLASFDRVVTSGAPELVLISGYSGVGKSSVVNELHKVLVPRGLFASGKFDQYKRDIPYSTVAQAFQSLIRHLLARSDTELSGWRDSLREALDPNGQLMVDLVPELKLIIGDQPPVPELEPQHAQRRFQLVLRRFIGVFARPEHPLALFLDDLQWLDAATLDLLEDLLTRSDLHHLMLIGAYRDNEVDAVHPLMRKLDTIRRAGVRVPEIRLTPLARDHVGQLVADALRCEPARSAELATLVYEKTAGNPFFLTQFLYALSEEGLLRFEHDQARWCWDVNRIHAKAYTENVVDLMVGKIGRLPDGVQRALQTLACLGNTAEIATLSLVQGASEEQVNADLWEAARLELIQRSDGSYKFVHDRIQEAAYLLIPEELRGEAHLRIGRLLAAHTPPVKRDEAIFEIVNQLNRGAALIIARDEREQLAEFNLIAGKRAKASTAYASALSYLVAGATLLAEDSWERQHELTFALELNQAECEFLTGALGEAEQRLTALSARAATTVERASVTCLRADLYTTLDQGSCAIAAGLDYLRHLGIDWSPHPTEDEARREYERIRSWVGSHGIENLVHAPLMTDPESLATVDVLTKIAMPAVLTDVNLYVLVVCRVVNLSLERGHSDGSCFAYESLLSVAGGHFGDYDIGFRFARLGYELVEQRRLRRFPARIYVNFGNLLSWTRHILAGRDMLRRASDTAHTMGDLTYVAYASYSLTTNLLAAGDPLVEVQREAEQSLALAQQMRFGLVVDIASTQLALVRTLRGLTPQFGSFDDPHFDQCRIEHRFSSNPDLARAECWYWIRRAQALYFAGDFATAVDASARARRLLWTTLSNLEVAEYYFYAALSHAASADSAPADARQRHVEALAAHHRKLQIWAKHCHENFENRAALVGAEIARLEGRDLDAECLYEQAIGSARANGFIHNEALAYELAARFYAARGFQEFARVYLLNARDGFLRWGADGKVRQLDRLHPHLAAAEWNRPTATTGSPVQQLDVASVVKASQAVSSEIELPRLIERLMTIALENAGADRGLLILPAVHDHLIQAEAQVIGDKIEVTLCQNSISRITCPESLIRYVIRTRETVILDDASKANQFSEDDYLCGQQSQSILCLPLIKQGRLTGLLYLENTLTSHAFTPDRIAVLELLAAQAAISLENIRLYSDLQEREAKVRRLVDSNIIGIFIWDFDGRIIEANEAFLHMVGHSRDDLGSGCMRWSELTPAELSAADERAVAELKATGVCKSYEKEFLRKDGSRVPVLAGAARFGKSQDRGVAFVLDLSERKRAEEALRESEGKLEEAQRVAHVGYWERYPAAKLINWSDETLRIFGLLPGSGAVTFERFRELVHPDDWQRIITAQAEAETLRSGEHYDTEFRAVRPNGEVRIVHARGNVTSDEAGRIRRIFGTVQDITERKRAEEDLRESERRYRETQMELAHVNRVTTMGQLTASIAHEVSQPIAAAVTNAGAGLRWLAAQPPDLNEVRDSFDSIIKAGNRAGDVIGRIRTLVKKMPPRHDQLDINEAILEVIEVTRSELQRNGVSLQTELAKGLPLIRGDRVQLQQILLNLIMNAIEAMSDVKGSRNLLISTVEDESNGVLVAVCDSGSGLSPESLEHLFDPFYTTKPGGMGMGLSICRSIIEAHGGRLWASANVPRGAIFQFVLPEHQGSAS